MRTFEGSLTYEQVVNGGGVVGAASDEQSVGVDLKVNSQAPLSNISSKRQRKYLPSLADLIDRLCICLMKMIFIEGRRNEYAAEIDDIVHDINVILDEDGHRIRGLEIKAITMLMLSNRFIWENESKTRNGDSTEDPAVQLQRLRATHSINGVRATAKNELSMVTRSRQDYKVDCFASDLPKDFGNWQVFDSMLRDEGDGES